MDKLRLQMKAVDEVCFLLMMCPHPSLPNMTLSLQILPDMRELMDQMNNLSILPADYVGRPTVTKWLALFPHSICSSSGSLLFDFNVAFIYPSDLFVI
jgi:VPS28 protein